MDYPWEHKVARKKWEYLQEKGYKMFHVRSTGLVFGTSHGGEAGHIDWWGKVIWKRDD